MGDRFKNIQKKLNDKYRLIILNDITLEERFSYRLSKLNAFVAISTLSVCLIGLTALAIVYTPLRYYIPGYKADITMRQEVLALGNTTDSLAIALQSQNAYIENLKKVLKGEADTVGVGIQDVSEGDKEKFDSIKLGNISQEDSMIREEVEAENLFALKDKEGGMATELSQIHFTRPVEGYITDTFNLKKDHFGIDVVGKEDAPVKTILGGVVIMNEYSVKTGHVIAVQHPHNLVSFYKHNSVLLKKVGTLVQSGEAIAIIGNSGELSDGPHLHLELWHNQSPVDPLSYIIY